MSCPATNHACIRCTTTHAALAARRQIGPSYYTLHAAAARPQYVDIAAMAAQIRRQTSKNQHGQQLHGQNYTDTLTLLRGHSRAAVDELLNKNSLNYNTRLMLKLELYG